MGSPERSRERIEEYLAGLEETYGSFPVNQRTVSLSGERFASVREREGDTNGFIEAYVQVHNAESDVLHVAENGDADLPGVRIPLSGRLERCVNDAVEDVAGVECRIDGLEQATIVGVRNADDPDQDTLFRMILVLNGTRTGGSPGENAEWRPAAGQVELLAR